MSPTKIRILYGSFIALFVVLSVLVFLFGLGYRYNLKKQSVVQHGGIAFSVIPTEAAVWINNEPQRHQNPFLFSPLTPGTHTVRIERENYFPWEKKVMILPGISTNLGRIRLFPQRLPTRITDPLPKQEPTSLLPPSPGFLIKETPRQFHITHAGTEGQVRLPRTPNAQAFSDTRGSFLYVFAPNEELFSLATADRGQWHIETLTGITGWEDAEHWLMLWGATDLWAFDKTRLEKILVSRRASGFQQAFSYRDTHTIYGSDRDIFASEISNRFGRRTVKLATFARIDDFFLNDDTVYIHAILSSKTTTPEWFEYRIIP